MSRRSKRGRQKAKQARRRLKDGSTEIYTETTNEEGQAVIEKDIVPPLHRQLLDVKDPNQLGVAGSLPADLAQSVLDAPDVRHFDDTRLNTGISVKQLVQEAELWWSKKGRKAMLEGRKSQVRTARSARHYKGPFTLDPDDPNALPSGVLHGLPWDSLNRSEKLSVAKAYHLVRYRVPFEQAEQSSGLILPH